MSDVDTLPPPDLQAEAAAFSSWDDERLAFLRLVSTLLPTHQGQYVAVYRERVIASGLDQVEVAKRAYQLAGYVPIYVGLVTDEPSRPVRLPSPRLIEDGTR